MRTAYSVASSVPTLILSVLLSACDGSDGESGTPGGNGVDALVTVSAEPAGAYCASGGSKIEAGPDTDGDGTLGAAEVSSTQYVCSGAAGTNGPNTLLPP